MPHLAGQIKTGAPFAALNDPTYVFSLPLDHGSSATLASHGETEGCGGQEACEQEPDKRGIRLE